MPVPVTRYRASRQFAWFGIAAIAIAVFSGWVALRWEYAWIAASLALGSAVLLFLVALQPAIEVHETYILIGQRQIAWGRIRRLDRLALVPLVMRLTLGDEEQVLAVHAGNTDSCGHLLRQMQQHCREALLDGVPYRQFWGDTMPRLRPDGLGIERRQEKKKREEEPPPPRYPMLLPDDEAEIERMFQRLRSGGKLDSSPARPGASPKSAGDSQ